MNTCTKLSTPINIEEFHMDRAKRRRRARNVAKHRELMLKQLNKFERRRPIKVGTLRKTLPEMHYRYSWRKTNNRGRYGPATRYCPRDRRQLCKDDEYE